MNIEFFHIEKLAILRWIVILFWKFLAFVGISILVLSRQSSPTDSPPCAGGEPNTNNLQRHLVRRQADQVQQTVVSIFVGSSKFPLLNGERSTRVNNLNRQFK